MTYNPNKPFAPGDKVLVSATIIKLDLDSDPHDPRVTVWFNGQAHETTLMSIQHDNSKKPITRSSWGSAPEFPATIPTPVPNQFEAQTWNPEDGETFVFNSSDFDNPGDLVIDVPPEFRTGPADDVDVLIDLVETPADEPVQESGGRRAPRNQGMIMDGRRGIRRSGRSNVIPFPDRTPDDVA